MRIDPGDCDGARRREERAGGATGIPSRCLRASLRLVGRTCFVAAIAVTISTLAQTRPAAQSVIAADQTTPRGALYVLALAMDAGDAAKIRSLLRATNPPEQNMVDALVTYHEAVARFAAAAVEAYGDADARKLTGDKTAAQAQELDALRAMREEIKADTAVVGADKATQIHLSRVDGKWVVPASMLAQGAEPAKLQEMIDEKNTQAAIFKEVTAGILNEDYKTADAASEALQMKLTRARMHQAGLTTQPSTRSAAPMPPS